MSGPGYSSPLEAMKNGPREKLLYVVCIQPNERKDKTDLLATVDVDPNSETYCQIIHRLRTGRPNDELHHSGWNVCSSCHGTPKACSTKMAVRDKLILPALGSDRIYIVDVGKNPRAPAFHKVIEADEVHKYDVSAPHTAHCLASGEIMVSMMGDKEGNAKCEFLLIDGKSYEVKGTWIKGEKRAKFGYDFWYQPFFDIMVSSEWGAPKVFKKGLQDNTEDAYGRSLNFFSWSKRELVQTIDLGQDGKIPLEIRYLHNPKEPKGFVGAAQNGFIYHFYLGEGGKWEAKKVIHVKPKKVSGWIEDHLNGLITDILISLDDKFLYLNNWFHGDVRQYDISDPFNPILTGQVFIGGKILTDSSVRVLEDEELDTQPEPVVIKGRRIYGGPQMMQLSLDGKRLYVSSSLFSPWDRQFYPETIKNGATLVKIDVDPVKGGMKLDEEFLVDFGVGPDGPLLAHEIRYPGGDCTSDIWLADN